MGFIQKGTIQFWKANVALFTGGFVTFTILYSTQPLFPLFTEEFGVSPSVASLSLSLCTGMLAVSMLAAAMVSDVWGRKRLMGVSLFLSAGIAVVTAFSFNFSTLLLLRAVQGVTLAGVPSIAMAYVGEEFHPKSLGLAMGLYISGNSLGGMAGRIISGMLTDLFSWRVALGVIGVIGLFASVLFIVALPREIRFRSQPLHLYKRLVSYGKHFTHVGLVSLFGIAFILMGSFVTLYNYIGYLLMAPPYNLSHAAVGWIFVVYLVGTFSAAWMGRLADVKERAPIIVSGMIIMGIGGLLTLSPGVLLKIVGVALFTFGFFGSHAVASGWIGERAGGSKAQASSLYLLFYYMGSSVIGTGSGWFWSQFGWIGVIASISVFIVVGLLLVYVARRETN